jgi:hypothetical protein
MKPRKHDVRIKTDTMSAANQGGWLGRGLAPCSVGSAYLLLPVSSGSASLAKP